MAVAAASLVPAGWPEAPVEPAGDSVRVDCEMLKSADYVGY